MTGVEASEQMLRIRSQAAELCDALGISYSERTAPARDAITRIAAARGISLFEAGVDLAIACDRDGHDTAFVVAATLDLSLAPAEAQR